MSSRLWLMNADFEAELASATYRRRPTIDRRNRRLAPTLLWLARAGDALSLEAPWTDAERAAADERGVALQLPGSDAGGQSLEPWGWTPSVVGAGRSIGASLAHPPLDVVALVNGKPFSHALERELGIVTPGAALASTVHELDAMAARACPGSDDKWVVKAPFGFAARERVLGRGPRLDPPSSLWASRRLARGDGPLLFEPWLDVRSEYGVQLDVAPSGEVSLRGISRMTTNGAGATTGFTLGAPCDAGIVRELETVARTVGRRLAAEGYWGPAGVDALEHANGLRPLLEINARHTMGRVALEVERGDGRASRRSWSPTA